MKRKYYLLLLLILSVFSGCDVATLSEEESINIAKYKANIIITDNPKNSTLSEVKVFLSDGKKKIINKQIKVLLNKIPMELFVKNDLYYTKTSFYKTDSLSRKKGYYFEIVLPDSTQYPLAYIAPEKSFKIVKFTIPKKIRRSKGFVLKWTQLNTPYFMEIIKGTEVKKKKAKNITEYGYNGRRLDTLRLETRSYTVPVSYFQDSLTIAHSLNLKLGYKEYGLINPKLLKNSDISYNYTINKTIEVIE